MGQNIRKIVVAAKESLESAERLGRVPYPCRALARISSLPGKGGRPQRPALSLSLHLALPQRSALLSPKRREKCRKSAQKGPGNHPATLTPSTT